MTMLNKITITILLLLIPIAFFHCLAVHVETEEFEPPQQEEQDFPGYDTSPGGGWKEETREYPYHFEKRSFQHLFQSKEGFVKMLPKFTKRSPTLLRGIENYRFALMEMEPSTFLVPHHFDADSVFLVLQGNGVIGFVTDKAKESYEITKGDVVRVPSSLTHFVANTNDTISFRIAKMVVPTSVPGHFKIPEELLGRLITGPQQGIMRRVSPEQIKELTENTTSPANKRKDKHKHEDTGTTWSTFNLLDQDPLHSNDFGHFYEALPQSFGQLQDLGISVAWTNMTQGSLFLPQYNSKTTFVTFVENGCARFEMASPYIFQGEKREWPGQEEEISSGQVDKIVARVCKGDVFIIPAGHPFAVLSQDHNFVSIGFGIHATNCTRMFLAGQENMLRNLDMVATRLTYGVGSKMAEKLFTSQNYSFFAPTIPCHQFPEKPTQPSFQSIFNFAGF